jgi:hypothetical protein
VGWLFLRFLAPSCGHPPLSSRGLTSLLAVFFFAALTGYSFGSGVTVITHGYNSDVNGWITGMADAVPEYPGFPGTNFTIYKIALATDGMGNYSYQASRTDGVAPFVSDSGEIIVKLDWSQMAGGSGTYNLSTSNVAWAATFALLQTNAIAELGGHALVELPLHLVGHSRGGSLMAELSRLLGTNGIWVDHLTTLDPHPLNNDGNFDFFFPGVVDAPAKQVYANVLFSDDYWQKLGSGVVDPDGEAVSGAYNRQLTSLPGGYNNASSFSPNHSNVHLWYHGTISLTTPTSDTEASITNTERQAWWTGYEQQGTNTGFEYSLIGGGNRRSPDQPVGPGYPAIVDGYNQWWDFGAGTSSNRTPISSSTGEWPNIIKLNLTGTNVVTAGNAVIAKFYYQYGGGFSNVGFQVYLDPDGNPFNSNATLVLQGSLPNTGLSSVYAVTTNFLTSTVGPGTYKMYATISDGLLTRYLYAPELVQVIPGSQAPILDIALLSGTNYAIGVNGAPGQTVALQTSTDLHNWLPIATNVLTSSRWVYTNAGPAAGAALFYRAVVSP